MHLIFAIPLEFIIWAKTRCDEIKWSFNCVNVLTNEMILFIKKLFGTWYMGGLFSLILCKQLVHMYDVQWGFIWIWNYIKCCFNDWFEKHLSCF
jgi:hypothetical protein